MERNELITYAQELANAQLLPREFQKQPGNILYAIEVARDLNISPIAAIRGMYVVGGRVGFQSHFMLAMANRAGVFPQGISYSVVGEGDNLSVKASAKLKNGSLAEEIVTMRMARAEGWTRNPKYTTMPVQMLKKRAVRMLIDNYCPEVMCGMGVGSEDDDEPQTPTQNLTPAQNLDKLKASLATAKPTPPPIAVPAAPPVPSEPTPKQPETAEPAVIPAATSQPVPDVYEVETVPVETVVTEPETPTEFNVDLVSHRQLITAALNELNLSGRWRNLHKPKLTEFLKKQTMPATAEFALAAVKQYVADLGGVQNEN